MGAPEGNKNAKGNSKFTQEIADKLCEELATSSKSLRTICNQEGMPTVKTILNWLTLGEKAEKKDDPFSLFLRQYARAREMQADFLAEEILEIADDGSNDLMTITKGDASYEAENKEVTNRSKLRVDARKWIASKLKPKKYGDRLDMDLNIPDTVKSFIIKPASERDKGA
jgi:hypothetical protein